MLIEIRMINANSIHQPEYLTATIVDWKYLLKKDEYKLMIINQLKEMIVFEKIVIYGFVIMNNHIHLIWQILGNNKSSEMKRQNLKKQVKHLKLI